MSTNAGLQDVYRAPGSDPAVRQEAAELYAGFWRRVAAYWLDSLILFIPGVVVGLVRIPFLGFFLQIGIWVLYKMFTEGGPWQATLGKRAMGIKVTTLEGAPISKARAVGRYFGTWVSTLILCIGLLLAGLTQRKQALHDMICSTLVVNRDATEEEIAGGRVTGTMPITAGVWVAIVFTAIFPLAGIVAAISIPAYQDYTTRAKMTEVVLEARAVQDEAAAEIAKARAGGEGGTRELAPRSPLVKRLVIDRDHGTVRAAVNEARLHAFQIQPNAEVVYTLGPDNASWSCAGKGIAPKYLPVSCR